MKLRITRIPPIRASLTIAGVCGALLIITAIVFTIIAALTGNAGHSPKPPYADVLLVAGGYFIAVYFIVVLFCLIYNMIAKRTGGLEIIVEDK